MAGITHLKQFQEPALRGLVDETVDDKAPTFADRYLPDSETYNTSFAYNIIKSHKNIGAMIGTGSEPPVVDRDEVAKMHGEIAKMGLKYIATEEELLALNQARNNGEQQAMIDNLTVQGVDLIKAIQRRVDVIKLEALTKGTFQYKSNGVKVDVDFGIPETNKVALSKGNDWAETSRDVIGDLLDFVDTYADENGEEPDAIYLSREVQSLLLKNSVIVSEARGSNSGANRVSVEELNSVLGGYGLPPVNVVTDRKITARSPFTGQMETIEFFPVNRIVMLSEGVGNYLFGPTIENNFEPGIVMTAKDKDEPIESIMRTVAAGFPAIEQPGRIFHADVYTPGK